MAESGLHMVYPAIMEELFGEDVYPDPEDQDPILAPKVRHFLDAYMAKHWHSLRAMINREHNRMLDYQEEIDEEWACKYIMF